MWPAAMFSVARDSFEEKSAISYNLITVNVNDEAN